MGGELTEKIIRAKTRLENLAEIKNLNLWGQELDDVSILARLPNIEVLSLSVNNISSLRQFANCPSLTELYLRKNNISNISEVRYLSGLCNLKTLWLGENPCADHPMYRQAVIRALPGLEKLDNTDIMPQEREQAAASAEVAQLLGTIPSVGGESPSYQPPPAYDAGPYQPVGASSIGGYGSPSGQMSAARQSMAHMNLGGGGLPSPGRAALGVGGGPSPGGPSARKSILYAIMALLPELGEEDLVYVRREVDQMLGGR